MCCEEIEKLMYLKQDELSPEERETLKDHLKDCEKCMQEYDKISHLIDQSNYENVLTDSRFLEARVAESLNEHQRKKHKKNLQPFGRLLLKALSIASVFFFFIFSIEQVSTISRISRLESRVQKQSPTSSLQYEKGELLVINHFISREELRTIAARHLNFGSSIGFASHRSPISQWSLWQQGLTSIEKNDLINDLINQVPAKIPLFGIGKISNINSDRINSLLQNH